MYCKLNKDIIGKERVVLETISELGGQPNQKQLIAVLMPRLKLGRDTTIKLLNKMEKEKKIRKSAAAWTGYKRHSYSYQKF